MALDITAIIAIIKQYKYIYSAVILIIFFILARMLLWIFEKIFLRIAKKTKTLVDDLIIEDSKGPLSLMMLFIGLRFAIIPLGIPEPWLDYSNHSIYSIIAAISTVLVARIFDVIIDNWGKNITKRTKSSFDDELLPIFHRFSTILIYIIGFLYILTVWGIEIGPLLASLGIAGIAVAFALQTTLSNIFGGISLILDKNFKVGDIVQLESGQMGNIDKISLRSTKIKTFDSEYIIVPNGKLANEIINNWTLPDRQIRITVNFSVAYGSDVEKVKKIVLDIIKKEKKAMKEPEPYTLFTEMADSSLNFIVRFFVDDISDKLTTKDRVTTEIYNQLNKAKITIPFPQMDVHVKK